MKKRDISNIDKAILHCADTRTDQNFNASDITKWHKERGWDDNGYHYVIGLKGELQIGRPLWFVGSHARGENTNSIGICLMGGKKPDGTKWDMCTDNQKETLRNLLKVLGATFPGLQLHGHYEFSSKSCPNFHINDLNFW